METVGNSGTYLEVKRLKVKVINAVTDNSLTALYTGQRYYNCLKISLFSLRYNDTSTLPESQSSGEGSCCLTTGVCVHTCINISKTFGHSCQKINKGQIFGKKEVIKF